MEFIKDDASHAIEGGIGLQAAQEQTVGDHFDAGGGRATLLKAHPVTHLGSDRFVQAGGQPFGGGLGRQTPGFQHQDCAGVLAPGLQQGQGHPGGFASTRRSLQQQGPARWQSRHNRAQAGFNRQAWHHQRAAQADGLSARGECHRLGGRPRRWFLRRRWRVARFQTSFVRLP